MNLNLKIGKHRIIINIFARKEGEEEIIGYTNRTYDGYYIPMIDYDNIDYDYLFPELVRLQDEFKLSHFYLFQSSKDSYHAVCFDKVPYQKLIKILQRSSVDESYINVARYGKKIWTLRITDKNRKNMITFKQKIYSTNKIYQKSKIHLDFIAQLFPEIPLNRDHQDNSIQMILSKYKI